jgi:hypothetical protein
MNESRPTRGRAREQHRFSSAGAAPGYGLRSTDIGGPDTTAIAVASRAWIPRDAGLMNAFARAVESLTWPGPASSL